MDLEGVSSRSKIFLRAGLENKQSIIRCVHGMSHYSDVHIIFGRLSLSTNLGCFSMYAVLRAARVAIAQFSLTLVSH